MIKYFFYLLSLCMVLSCSEDVDENSVQYAEPTGALKMKIFSGAYNEYKYDLRQRLVLINNIWDSGERYAYTQISYDEFNRVMEETYFTKPNYLSKYLVRYHTSSYEYKGENLVKIITYSHQKGELSSQQIFEYDELGNKIKDLYYTPTIGLNSYSVFIYHGNNLFREFQYGSTNELVMAFEYQYDSTGRLQNRLFLENLQNPSDSTTAGVETEYIYNDKGQLILKQSYDPYFGYAKGEMTWYEYYE